MQADEKRQPLLATVSILNRNAINVVMHKDVAREKGITERSVALTTDFMLKIGAIKARIPYDKLVTQEYLPKGN
jgi:hypothetical protein